MKQGITKKVGWAWILLMIFIPQLIVTSLHLHKPKEYHEVCHASDHHEKSDAEQCALCKYTISAFTEVELPDFTFIPQATPYKRDVCEATNYYATTRIHYNLRAPPAIMG